MGVPGLFGFLEYYQQSKQLKYLIKNKNIGIDIFWFMHRCKGNIEYLKNCLSPYFINCETCYFVFDGRVPDEKKSEKELQRIERDKINKNIAILESQILDNIDKCDKDYLLKTIEQMKKDNWTPRSEFINEVKNICTEWNSNIKIVNAPFEADTWLVKMEKNFDIDFIISNDSDLIINGCIKLIRPKIINGNVKIYDINNITNKIKCTLSEWIDLCNLIRTYKGDDIIILYSWWRKYRNSEIIYYIYRDNFNINENLQPFINKQIKKSVSPPRRST